MTQLITITGPQGCGKTTKAETLRKELEATGKKVAIFDEDYPQNLSKDIDVVIFIKQGCSEELITTRLS